MTYIQSEFTIWDNVHNLGQYRAWADRDVRLSWADALAYVSRGRTRSRTSLARYGLPSLGHTSLAHASPVGCRGIAHASPTRPSPDDAPPSARVRRVQVQQTANAHARRHRAVERATRERAQSASALDKAAACCSNSHTPAVGAPPAAFLSCSWRWPWPPALLLPGCQRLAGMAADSMMRRPFPWRTHADPATTTTDQRTSTPR